MDFNTAFTKNVTKKVHFVFHKLTLLKFNLNAKVCKSIENRYHMINMICSFTEYDTIIIKTSCETTKFLKNIERDVWKWKRSIRWAKQQYSPLVLCIGYHKSLIILSPSLIGICQYALFKSRTVKTSASSISSRIFSAFGIGKAFGIVLAYNFRKSQH